MRFEVERDALAEAVAWVARALPSRPVVPVLSGLLLRAADDTLTLSCFDYEVSARIQLDAEVAEPGTALVPGRLLAEITRSLPSLAVEAVQGPDDLTLTCGEASFTLVTLPVHEYPRLPELPRLAGTVDGGAFATAIGQVVPAASRDDTLPVLTGVNMEFEADVITMVATDRYRLAIRELGWHPAHPDAKTTLLVPARTLADAARMMAPGVLVRVMTRAEEGPARAAEATIGFESAGRRLTTRLISTEYIKYASQFPKEFGSRGDMPAVQLTEAVKRVALVAERGSSVRLSFGGGKVTIEAGTEGQARAREAVPAEFSGDQTTIAFSPHYLLDGLGAALTAATEADPKTDQDAKQAEGGDQARISLQFTSPTRPALITGGTPAAQAAPAAEEPVPDFRYLVVPLRALTSV